MILGINTQSICTLDTPTEMSYPIGMNEENPMTIQEIENEIYSECYQMFVSMVEDKLEDMGVSGKYGVTDIDIKLGEWRTSTDAR